MERERTKELKLPPEGETNSHKESLKRLEKRDHFRRGEGGIKHEPTTLKVSRGNE